MTRAAWRGKKYERQGMGVTAYRVRSGWFGMGGNVPADVRRHADPSAGAQLEIDQVGRRIVVRTVHGDTYAEIGDRIVYDGVFGWAAVRKMAFGHLFRGVGNPAVRGATRDNDEEAP